MDLKLLTESQLNEELDARLQRDQQAFDAIQGSRKFQEDATPDRRLADLVAESDRLWAEKKAADDSLQEVWAERARRKSIWRRRWPGSE